MFNCSKPVSPRNLEEYFKEDFKRQKNRRETSGDESSDAPSAARIVSNATDESDNTEDRSFVEETSLTAAAERLALRHSKIEWHGKLAARLGLSEEVSKEHFKRLCEGKHPLSGEQLIKTVKPRRKINYKGKEIETLARRAGLPQTVSAPKSVSLLVPHDERVIAAHQRAVGKALETVERFTRVKMGNSKSPATTGETIRILFVHFEARPDADTGFSSLDLHTHCPPLNLGFDGQGKPRALEFRETLRSQKLGTAVYRAALVGEMQTLGYAMEINERTGAPEVVGISRAYIEATSTRHREIVSRAERLGVKSTKEIAVSYRQSKKFDRAAMNARRAALDEQFDSEARRAAERALRKTEREKSEELKESATANDLQEIVAAKTRRAIEAVDFVLTRAEQKSHAALKKRWISQQNLLAETINHARFELTIDDVLPEFQKRFEQGKSVRQDADERKIISHEKNHVENNSAERVEITERSSEISVNSSAFTNAPEALDEEHQKYAKSNRIESNAETSAAVGKNYSIESDDNRKFEESAGVVAVNFDDSKFVSTVFAENGAGSTGEESIGRASRIADHSELRRRERHSRIDGFADAVVPVAGNRIGTAEDNRAEAKLSDDDSAIEFADRNFGSNKSIGRGGAGNATFEDRKSGAVGRNSVSELRDRTVDRTESILLDDADGKSEDAEEYSQGNPTNWRRSTTMEREPAATLASDGVKRTENSSVERKSDRGEQPLEEQFQEFSGSENTVPVVGGTERTTVQREDKTTQDRGSESDGQSKDRRTEGEISSREFTAGESSEGVEQAVARLESTTSAATYKNTDDSPVGGRIGSRTVEKSENSDGKRLSIENVENSTDDVQQTESGKICRKLPTRNDERKESDDLASESNNVFVSGRNDSGGMGAGYSEGDSDSVNIGDGRHQNSRNQGTNQMRLESTTAKQHQTAQNASSDSHFDSDSQQFVVFGNDIDSMEPQSGSTQSVARSANNSADYFSNNHYGNNRDEDFHRTESQVRAVGSSTQVEKIDPHNAVLAPVFDDYSFSHLSLRQLDIGAANLGQDIKSADHYNDYTDNLDNSETDSNETLRLDSETRRQILDLYRRQLNDRIEEARTAEEQKTMRAKVIDLLPTEDAIYTPSFNIKSSSSAPPSTTNFSQMLLEQNIVQPTNQADLNQRTAEQNIQNQTDQVAVEIQREQENAASNQYYFDDEVRRNFITYADSSQLEAEDDFWKKDRLEREAQIALDTALLKSRMSESERPAYEAAASLEEDEYEQDEELMEEQIWSL